MLGCEILSIDLIINPSIGTACAIVFTSLDLIQFHTSAKYQALPCVFPVCVPEVPVRVFPVFPVTL